MKSLSLTNIFSNKYEPKRQNRWVMSFTPPIMAEAAGMTSEVGGYTDELAFAAHTSNRPEISYEQIEHHRQNERFYVAGKPTWNELTMEFYDFVNGPKSVSHIMWLWSSAVYNPITGAMGYKMDYVSTGTLSLLDPIGDVAETWSLFYLWPATITWNELSSESSEIMNVSVTFRYDYALMGTPENITKYDS